MPPRKEVLKVGLIGSGAIAQEQHLPYWRELEAEGQVEILGICDLIRERREEEAAKCAQAKAYADYKKMLAAVDFDIIDVCTQNRVHAPATIAALEKGAHVLVEKPMAMNSKECEAMIAAARKNKRKLMVAQHMRFEARAEKLKEVVDSGALGDIYTAETKWLRRRGIPGWGKFHLKKESLGGPLIDIGVHMMDLCIWLMGSPVPVAASGKVYRKFGDRTDLFNADWGVPYPHQEFDVEDYAVALIRFEKGLTMTMSVSWAANTHDEIENLYILGDKGGIGINPLGFFSADHSSLNRTTWDWLDPEDGHRREIRHFCECVQSDKEVMVKPEESLRIQKIIDAIYESSRKNKEIVIK
ncbi:MAG: Gfo/Idh/MocA family oxidoreductase [Candidatus Hydrogenedentes bacterium]|jgi:predicted dehydrogenase|nr:Gfo/Idh/MocA family oxidoreductase [Candidatus Hydrogenedentota bacterium]